MKIAIITVAGVSSRFNEGISADQQALKAIYYEEMPDHTLLYQMAQKCSDADQIVIVGGYLFEQLQDYIETKIPREIQAKTIVVFNPHYSDYQSGYSLYLGIQEVLRIHPLSEIESILFAEGDLDVDQLSFDKILESPYSVLTSNLEMIQSKKSVVVYLNGNDEYHYAFNQQHGLLEITEPFQCIFNSGQIWKFHDIPLLSECCDIFITSKMQQGSNLEIIGPYFSKISKEKIEVIPFGWWVNCNTRADYQIIVGGWKNHEKA